MSSLRIIVIKIDYRSKSVPDVQHVLTRYGCDIKLRVGFHETSEDLCSEEGIIILQLTKNDKELLAELNEIEGVKAQQLDI